MVPNSCLCGRCSGVVPGLLRTRHLIPIVNNLDGLSQEHRSSTRTREAGKLGGINRVCYNFITACSIILSAIYILTQPATQNWIVSRWASWVEFSFLGLDDLIAN
jgi:hypothetical protein